jgi:hypothetical protein
MELHEVDTPGNERTLVCSLIPLHEVLACRTRTANQRSYEPAGDREDIESCGGTRARKAITNHNRFRTRWHGNRKSGEFQVRVPDDP